jgi:zinc transport system ATP-binding protein
MADPPLPQPPASGGTTTPQGANALEVERLSVSFGKTRVIRDLTFSVPRGASLAVIGPSGSGKTVLFKTLIGAVPHEGDVRWAAGTKIGYVPQKLDIERDLPLTGQDLLRARAGASGAPAGDVARVIALVKLSREIVTQPIGTLSGGQFQRLLLAFALVGRPNVLLFDEPTAGVDEPAEERLYAMIRRVQAEEHLTLLLISHELSIVYRYATSVLCLSRGRPALSGPPLEILTPANLEAVYGAPLSYHQHEEHAT